MFADVRFYTDGIKFDMVLNIILVPKQKLML